MIGRFRYEDGAYRARIEPPYSTLIVRLMREILVVLDEPAEMNSFLLAATDLETGREAPEERALEYLLPAMSLDPEDASSLRALTEDFLRAEKSSRLRQVAGRIERAERSGCVELMIPTDEVWEWLAALNDVRLGLAGELKLETDADVARIEELAGRTLDGSREQAASVFYSILTWWQDSLISALNSSGVHG